MDVRLRLRRLLDPGPSNSLPLRTRTSTSTSTTNASTRNHTFPGYSLPSDETAEATRLSSKYEHKHNRSNILLYTKRVTWLGVLGILAWLGGILRLNDRLWLLERHRQNSMLLDFHSDPQLQTHMRKQAIVPWAFHGRGIYAERDRLVEWWGTHPEAPMGLSCSSGTSDNRSNNNNPHNKMALSTTSSTANGNVQDGWVGFEFPPPVFHSRIPVVGKPERVQIVFVVPFVELQLPKVVALLFDHWSRFPPCQVNTQVQSADLVFFTEIPLSTPAKERILTFYELLGKERTGCFHSKKPRFITLGKDTKLSHLEGAAYSFYQLFPLLEQDYQAFILAEPDVAPIQPNWLPALVYQSAMVGCGKQQYWQIGSAPFARDFALFSANLKGRLDYHLNGNAIYALGCPDFEDYKCRVQTYYLPTEDCALVAGCQTHKASEGGYDHALYQFRMQPDNYEYSRSILHKFHYSPFLKNYGEEAYTPEQVTLETPETFFVHSKAIYMTPAATLLSRVIQFMFGHGTCDVSLLFAPPTSTLQKMHRYVRSGEYTQTDVIHHLCQMPFSNSSPFHKTTCALAKEEMQRQERWDTRMPGRTYIWNIDMHGAPTNCDLPIITKVGGSVHAELDGNCEWFGLCTERLKVLPTNDWKKGYAPSDAAKVDFYNAYKDDPEFRRVDAFLCHHPVANCELFTKFGKPIIVHATTRLEFGRHDAGIDWRLSSGYTQETGKVKWKQWIHTMKELAKDKRNVIAANNVYDQHYIKFFTGIENVELLPSWCGEAVGVRICDDGWDSTVTSRSWLPSKPEVVIVPYRSNLDRTRYEANVREPEDHPIILELRLANQGKGIPVKSMKELYGNGNTLNLLQHPAVVIIPYQVSTMQLVELYRLNIPMFCPSLKLLKTWCQKFDLLWEVQYGWPEDLVPESHPGIPNPNGHLNMDKYGKEWIESFDFWVPKSDFYVFPHLHYFDSWNHFFELYEHLKSSGGLEETYVKMMQENHSVYASLLKQWEGLLQRVKTKSPTGMSADNKYASNL
jgi:hypothetical protein